VREGREGRAERKGFPGRRETGKGGTTPTTLPPYHPPPEGNQKPKTFAEIF